MAVRRILTLMSCGAFGALAASAHASPRSDPTTGRAVFTGATQPHATSLVLNPSALGLPDVGQSTGIKLYVAMTSLLQQVGIERELIDIDTGARSAGAQVDDLQLGLGGTVGIVVHPSERFTLGAQIQRPLPEMHPAGHDALRYHTLGTGQRGLVVTVGGSFRITSRFYFGASVAHENTFLRLRYARDTALERGRGPGGIDSDCGGMPCGVENPAATELYDVEVSSNWIATSNLKVNIGTVARIAPGVWLGLAYHTPPGLGIQTGFDGTMDVTRAPRDGGEVLHGGSTVYVSFPASVDAELRARLPADLELHVGGRWEDLSRMQAYDVRGYGSRFRNAGIPEWTLRPRGMHDAVALWAGVEQLAVSDDRPFQFGGRLGFETSAVDDARTSPLTIAPTSLTVDLGAQASIGQWQVQLAYGLQYFPPISVGDTAFDPRRRLDCIDSGYDYATPGCAAVRNGYALPSAAGDYRQVQHALRLGFRYAFP